MAGDSFSGLSSSVRVRTSTHVRSGRLRWCSAPFARRRWWSTPPGRAPIWARSSSSAPRMKISRTNQCKFFMWEDKYKAYLVDNGLLHVDNSSLDDAITQLLVAVSSMEATLNEFKLAVNEVQETMEEMKNFMTDMQGAILAIPPVLTTTRNTMNGMYGEMKGLKFGMAGNVALVNKNRRLGEKQMMVAWLITFLLVAVLAVFLKK